MGATDREQARVLIADDESSVREFLEIFVTKMGHQVVTVDDGSAAIAQLAERAYDLVLTDLKMPGASGMDVLQAVKESQPDAQVVMMTAFSTTETAIEAMKVGAYDYIAKPFKITEMRVVIDKALEKTRLLRENSQLRTRLDRQASFEQIVGRSEAMQEVFQLVRQIAPTRSTVLITGESGTGKELIARAIHHNSPREERPFVVINCGVIPENLMESEMFGHVRGAFTGAIASKKGLFEQADTGTLFLDEVAELPLQLQVKLLRVLEDKRVRPVGQVRDIEVDVRIVAATNRDLESEVAAGRFREDLFYRLNVIRIRLPPLRERRSDIPFIANHFLDKYTREMNKAIRSFEPAAMQRLLEYDFGGNVRELENLVERAVAVEAGETIRPASLPPLSGTADDELPNAALPPIEAGFELEPLMEKIERGYILEALRQSGGNKTEAAKLLGLSFRALRYKVSKYGLSDADGPE